MEFINRVGDLIRGLNQVRREQSKNSTSTTSSTATLKAAAESANVFACMTVKLKAKHAIEEEERVLRRK